MASIHGQMDKELVERRMLRFVRGEVDVLLATTIIESGLDIPNANTIILRDADRYGLAELHQLRGRVGRERRQAHALVLLPQGPAAAARSRASGCTRSRSTASWAPASASRCATWRSAARATCWARSSAGHIAAVGYDLYCRLLAECRGARAGAAGPSGAREPAFLGIDVPGGVPLDYVGDAREKFRIFRRIAASAAREDLDDLADELEDRFGKPPRPGQAAAPVPAGAHRARAPHGIERIAPAPAGPSGVILHAPPAALGRSNAAVCPCGG